MAHHLIFNIIIFGPMVKRPKTPPFHGGNPGSNPGGVTKTKKKQPEGAAFPSRLAFLRGARYNTKIRRV
jgi:hypothetical protein